MILRIGETKKNNAFTLVEVLLVIIIVGVVLGLAAPNFSNGYARFQLNNTVNDLISICRWAQAMAIGQERTYALSFSEDRRSYGIERVNINEESNEEETFEAVNGALGRRHTLPEMINLETEDDRIEFYPDGTIDQANIEVDSPDHKTVLSSTEVRGMMSKVDDE